ncbi:MAG: hypothetical protein JRI63_12620 [Deltaproteobacteria bacterium]|nr:hypothetical protein [Deltaproteobacteria bacterium]
MEKKYRYLFGPVPSRRFGRSLGVDLTPYKICSMDCIFCQLGRTTEKTVARKEYVPTDIVLSEPAKSALNSKKGMSIIWRLAERRK